MLHIKFGTVVVPIVIYSDNSRKPLQQRWTRYELGFAGHKFLDFRFLAVHPASMPVREYLKSHNPAQLALAARMDLGNEDMVRIKLDLMRQLADLTMNEEQIEHAVGYLEAYLEEKDSEAFQRELALLKKPKYREARMLIEHFKNLGLTEGRAEGRAEGARAQAIADARKFLEHGVSWEIITNATGLKPEDLEAK